MHIHNFVKHCCAVCLCLLTASSGFAQQPADSFSLHMAIARTLQNYPAIQAKQAQIKSGEANLTDVKHDWYPALRVHEQVDVGTDNSIYGSYFTMGMIPSTSGGIREKNTNQLMSGNIAMAQMQWEVYNFGAFGSRTMAAHAALNTRKSDLSNTQNQLTIAIIQDYLELLRLTALQKVTADNIQRTEAIQRAVNATVKYGLKPGVDSAVAAAELSKARLNLLEVNGQYNRLRIELAAFTGIDTTHIAADTLNELKLAGLLERFAPQESVTTQHPLLQFYQSQYEQQKALETVIRKANLPKVNVMAAGWMRGSSGEFNDYYNKNLWSGLGYKRYNYLLGLGITYNFTDLKRTREKAAVQHFTADAAAKEQETMAVKLQQSLDEAQSDIAIAQQRLAEIPSQLQAAQAAAIQKTALYKAGLTNIIEVTNALFLLNRAETDMIQARDAAWKALFRAAYAGNTLQDLLPALH